MCCFHPEKKVIYIHIPKTAGITVEVILRKQFNFQSFSFPYTIDKYAFLRDSRGKIGILKYILKYSNESKIYDLTTFKVITTVRDPYARCESAIRYLHKNSGHNFKFPMNIMDFYHTCLIRDYFYMHFCLSQKKSLLDLNNNLNIAYICKFENLFDDLAIALFDVCGFERIEIKQIHVNSSDKQRLTLNPEEIRKLIRKIHQEDFEFLGYPIDKQPEENNIQLNENNFFEMQEENFVLRDDNII